MKFFIIISLTIICFSQAEWPPSKDTSIKTFNVYYNNDVNFKFALSSDATKFITAFENDIKI